MTIDWHWNPSLKCFFCVLQTNVMNSPGYWVGISPLVTSDDGILLDIQVSSQWPWYNHSQTFGGLLLRRTTFYPKKCDLVSHMEEGILVCHLFLLQSLNYCSTSSLDTWFERDRKVSPLRAVWLYSLASPNLSGWSWIGHC
jgi:hypothetical protein